MAHFPFYWVDAFTETKLGGNPCAVVLGADALTSEVMLSIAKEMNLSETAFVKSSSKADFGARYFTPERELPFAGHPTIAVIHALLDAGLIKGDGPSSSVRLELPAGVIPIDIVREGERNRIVMSQLPPKFLRTYEPSQVLSAYGLSSQDLLPGAVIQTVSTGTPILMIPLVSHAALRKVRYADFDLHEKLMNEGDYLYPHFFCLGGATPEGATFARSLGGTAQSPEDPFTGSSTGCMAAYLWNYGLLSGPRFVAEQGHWMGRPGRADVEVVGDRDAIRSVRVGGHAVTVIRGTLDLG